VAAPARPLAGTGTGGGRAGQLRQAAQGYAAGRTTTERGVGTVFVSLPDLARPDDVLRLAPVTAAFA
jgi:hypothetical protein